MEAKYRVWDKDRKEYLSAGMVFIGILPKSRPVKSEIYLDIIQDPDRYKERFIVEQCAGLKDKNGIDIFEGDRLRAHGNPADICVAEYGEFNVINAETLEVIDRVIGWNTHVLKTDAMSECEPFCMTMPLNQEYINRCEYEVLAKKIHEVKMEKVKS